MGPLRGNRTLPQILMSVGKYNTKIPTLAKQVAQIWERAVTRIIKVAPFSRDLVMWDVPAFRKMSATVDISQCRNRGCETLADLYPNDDYISFERAKETFGVTGGAVPHTCQYGCYP